MIERVTEIEKERERERERELEAVFIFLIHPSTHLPTCDWSTAGMFSDGRVT